MTPVTATNLNSYASWVEVELIVNHDDRLRLNLKKLGRSRNRLSGQVHIRKRFQKCEFFTLPETRRVSTMKLLLCQCEMMPFTEVIDTHKPNIMTGCLVSRLRIPKPDKQKMIHCQPLA